MSNESVPIESLRRKSGPPKGTKRRKGFRVIVRYEAASEEQSARIISLLAAMYQQLTKAIRKTTYRDLDDLVRKGVLAKFGKTGRGTYYGLASKGDNRGTGPPEWKTGPSEAPFSDEEQRRAVSLNLLPSTGVSYPPDTNWLRAKDSNLEPCR